MRETDGPAYDPILPNQFETQLPQPVSQPAPTATNPTPPLAQPAPAAPAAPTAPAAPALPAAPAAPTPPSPALTPEQSVEQRAARIVQSDSPIMQAARSQAEQAMNARGLINSSLAVGAGQQAVLGAATDIAKQDAAAAVSKNIAQIEAQYKNLTQASASASALLNNLQSGVARIMENESMDAAAKQRAIEIFQGNANRALQMVGAISGDVDLMAFFDEVLQP